MPNEIQIECYFKSADLLKLCKESEDIVINFKASYLPDSPPTFKISADSFTKGAKAGKAIKSAAAASADKATEGCPKPCS